ncbi:hypothetical protein C1T31_12265 [Hanstruepera neustonica]|uniref:Adhesin domain-containing protein n=1 Tax=Hanstruepera neustonica TaxID=1445657 RepID=A0A2K1DWA8_9FLAO|nr:hypothetical protein [Hanstruepera neustonica]PNQ72318.1 hypothetical protein C1T31_12265 [Hanstruepera neustonica]
MKTTILSKTLFLFLLLPAFMLASNNPVGVAKHEKSKTIKKSFNVNANAELKVDNSYGNLDIVTWNENRIEIEVTITVEGGNEEKVLKKLDEITVEFESSSNMVSAKTVFNKNKSKSWWNWNSGNNSSMSINYVIKMPMSNSVDLDNDYGSITLDKLEGRAQISCDYGRITTKELMASNNTLSFDYTQNCYFEYVNGGSIDADYSGFTIAKAKNINLSADYTKSVFEVAEDITYDCDYGSFTADKANNVTGNGDYLTVVLGDIYKNVSIDADYGSIKIKRMTANAGNITINSDYVGINIGYDSGYHFNFDIDLDYASLRDSDGFEFNKKRTESGSKYYSGYYGSASSGNLVKINSDYGSVTFNKN